LIIAFFEFPVNINIFDIENTKMHKDLTTIGCPCFEIDLSLLVDLEWFLLNLELFLKIIKRVL